MRKLGFGYMRLPLTDPENVRSIDLDKVCEMTDYFISCGLTYFDTAYMYHEYKSEFAIRDSLVKRHPRENFILADKLPIFELTKKEEQETVFNDQLEKCGVDYFDYYLIHNLTTEFYKTAQKFDCFGFIAQKKREGKIKQIGFSFHDSAELLDKILCEHPETDFVQLQVNYLDWESENVQSRKCCEVAQKHGKPIIVMEPVKGGTLANLPDEARALVKAYNPKASPASLAIRFAASVDGVFMVLSGMSNMEQLLDNASYMQDFVPLCAEERELLDRISDILKSSPAIPCTVCRYCVDTCPQSIPIPELFSLYNSEKAELGKENEAEEDYYLGITNAKGKASDCIACGACEDICPQHIKIIDCLKDVTNTFEQ